MPIYEYRCECGVRFEQLVQRTDAAAPGCPRCGGDTAKIPSSFALGGRADAGLSREQMPQTWKGTYGGDREYVSGLRRQWDKREKLEAHHPELAGDSRPIVAHEGRYEGNPLRAGDPGAPGHGHGHGHGHGND
ncbi:MAG: zinc ribbon domain-containing protein [Pseudonocardiaceae bacterium]|nr:zinc ribbon domain-containing protein [Pseudonocardiaceae bacterium]